MACSVCSEGRRALLCPSCFVQQQAGLRDDLQALTEQRDAAAQQLAALVEQKEAHQRQQLALLALGDELRCTRARAAEAERLAAAVRQRAAEARQALGQRQEALAAARQDLAALKREAGAGTGPAAAAFDQQALACHRVEAALREQRMRVVRRAMQILPLMLVPPLRPASPAGGAPGTSAQHQQQQQQQQQQPGAAGAAAPAAGASAAGGGGTAAGGDRASATICGLPLPDPRASWGEVAAAAPCLGSSLGYLALLLDLLARLLQLPLPHRCAFRGSATRLWLPDGFWDTRASPPNDALLAAWPKGAAEGGGGGGGHSEWGASLAAAVGAGSGASAAAAQAATARQEQQLRAALALLARGAGGMVAARLGPDAALKLPPDWSPFAWLAGLCKVLAAEGPPRPPASLRMAVPGGGGAPQGLAASGVFGRYSPENGGMAQSVLLFPDGPGDEAEEGWEHLPRPAYGMIPPPPSQPEDVEHWVAAHGLQAASTADGGGGGSGGAAALYGSSPMARLRALTRAALGSLPLGGSGG